MQGLRSKNNLSFVTAKACFVCSLFVCMAAAPVFAQDEISYVHPNQEVRVANLPSLTASSTSKSAVLATALETILENRALCCGKGSALEDIVLSNPASLMDVSIKLQGKHVLGDGRSVIVSAGYVPQGSITPDLMIGVLMDQHALLIEWKAHLYVLHGAIFDKTVYTSGRQQLAIRKLLLRDPRFSDQRSEVEFNRATDDWGQVQGLLTVAVVRQ